VFKNQVRPAIVLTLLLCVLTGLVYPGVITGVAQVLFPRQANGSLITTPTGQVIGSALLGQQFARAEYFHSRPSAAGAGYDDTLTGGTNKGPTDVKLADTLIAGAVDSEVKLDGAVKGHVPADLATSSASGVDPHISPASALLQVARVARARHLDSAAVRTLVDRHVEGRQLGVFGEPRVNVLLLNLALDSLSPHP
jgi:K+-transporting ATPase ATPase C chain